ncbi:MAG: riboflavin biosynthesis protein RibD [Deltaproteobacteria bacterium CG_4_10_14_0_2_um_filter_43_8]|nr:MAG: riboflavin biosynthesis protein RibD [Deltaproteobacteria bacterium CG11_big_fil_rev_8_21_14_0_20_42_23]PJA18567.1 MAG: riboflavin biosynthesis protein RibD [Deltaproteobacteria bacterium CG_4_10_14_0_2_um_filter_43_8]PJC64283.1 MAG: riboflavin biosynthesis protein RibD [Deltaproteobacteria bacterium CG_4_9_14_0_2_um_filter_42_21]
MPSENEIMKQAIALAKKASGNTAPNPLVGAAVVKQGKIIASAYHQKAGTPHAEIHALKKAKQKAKGATLFVTLEPCCHHGKTPPCVEAIIAAGIKNVVVGCKDPNPLVAGKGIRALRKAGITVKVGVLKKECEDLIKDFSHKIKTNLPYVIAKVAVSLDGKIATSTGESKWITNEQTRIFVHEERKKADAIVVGVGTVLADDPRLSIRLGKKEVFKPAVVFDAQLRMPLKSKLYTRKAGQLILCVSENVDLKKTEAARKKGHHLLKCKTLKGQIVVRDALHKLAQLGFQQLFLEGGGRLLSSFLNENCIQELLYCQAPIILGGSGRDVFPNFHPQKLSNALKLMPKWRKSFGDDLVTCYNF